MPEPHNVEEGIVRALEEALQKLPNVAADPAKWEERGRDRHVDAVIHFRAGDQAFVLIVETKKSVYPREARDLLWQVKNYAEFAGHRQGNAVVVPLIAAEALSPGAKELLKSEGVGYYDTGGSLFIPARGAYVYIEKPPPRILRKAVHVLFRGKRAQVLHALLHNRDKWLGVKSLAEIARVSPATASETLTALERFEWMAMRGQGPSKERHVTNPRALLDEWKKQVLAARQVHLQRYYVRGKNPEAIVHQVAALCDERKIEYAVTQEAAAQMYAPFISATSRAAFRIVPGRTSINELAGQLEAMAVTEGANLILIESKQGEGMLFKEQVDSVWLANPVQVYLDLLRSGGRAEEMAEHLRRERIGF
jgi:hypothetical protein